MHILIHFNIYRILRTPRGDALIRFEVLRVTIPWALVMEPRTLSL